MPPAIRKAESETPSALSRSSPSSAKKSRMPEATIYRSEAPQGFYAQLANNRVPAWLQPVRLPQDSPFRMYRVARPIGFWPS